jgi:hypothetical protein
MFEVLAASPRCWEWPLRVSIGGVGVEFYTLL